MNLTVWRAPDAENPNLIRLWEIRLKMGAIERARRVLSIGNLLVFSNLVGAKIFNIFILTEFGPEMGQPDYLAHAISPC